MPVRTPQSYYLLVFLFAALVLTFFILLPFLAPLALGAVFAVVLHPLYRRIARSIKGWNTVAALITVVISIVVILIPTILLGTQMLREAQQLYGSLASGQASADMTASIQHMGPFLERYLPGSSARLAKVPASIDTYVQEVLAWIIQNVGFAFSGAAGLFVDLFIFFISLYYFLRDGAQLRRLLIELSPLADDDDEIILVRLEQAVNSVVKGKLAVALIQGVLAGLGFALFGVPNPVLWGLIAAIASFIPPFGTALVLVPGVVYLIFVGTLGEVIGLALWGSLAIGLVDNMLAPKLMSRGTQLHPLLVLLSVLGGMVFFGPVGVFLGPLIVSLLLALLFLYRSVGTNAKK